MSDIIPDNINANNTSTQLDLFDTPLVIPVSRLDADQYSADDIDGVTESIFGSGNMAYASLQASQTDASIALNEALNLESDQAPDQAGAPVSGSAVAFGSTGADAFNLHQDAGRGIPTDTDRALDARDVSGAENIGAEGNFSQTTVGALGASALSSDAGSFSPSYNLDLGENTDISRTINNVTNNTNVNDTIQNVVNTVTETINNITNLGDDIVENILEGDVEEVVNIVNNQFNELTETITTEVNNVTETVNNILQDFGVTEITNQVTEITNETTEVITNTVNEVLDNVLGDGGIVVDLDTGILETLGTDLHIAIEDGIEGNLGTDMVSDNLAAITGDLTGLNIPVVSDTGINIGFDLLSGGDANDGNDISVAGISTPDIALDPVEGIVGDIDIEVALPTELSDPYTLVEGVEGIVESLDDVALADPETVLNILGDEGAEGTLDIVAGDTALGEDIALDANSIIDDLDANSVIDDLQEPLNVDEGLNIDDAVDMLASVADSVIDDAGSLLGDAGWTESTINTGGMFDDIVNGMGGESDPLPDPTGTVAEGLGVLDVEPSLDTGGLGGLFG